METIEIRLNKKDVIPMLAVLTTTLIGMTFFLYFSGKFDNNNTTSILLLFIIIPLLYMVYITTKKILRNEPVLIFSKSGIEINKKGKPVSFLWLQVIDWKIENVQIEQGGSHYYLTIQTADIKEKINISWLDKSPGEIQKLLQAYKAG